MTPRDVLTAAPPPRICIVLLSGIGDVVHGLPVVNAIRRARPDARITWVVEPPSAPLLAPHPSIDRVVVFRKREGVRGVARLRHELGTESYDLTLNLNVYTKSVFPTVLSGAPVRLGFDRARAAEGVWLFSTHRLPPGPRRHTQDLFLEFLDVLGVEREPLEWRLEPTAAERAEADGFVELHGAGPYVALVPASANRKKDWLPDRMAAVVDALWEAHGLRTLLVGGTGERETRVADAIVARSAHAPVRALGPGLRRLLWLLPLSRFVIAPDTGPVHVARALGVPVVGLYGHTNPWRVGPYRAYEDLWVDRYNEPGSPPDASLREPKLGRMEAITVGDVMERAEAALERYAGQSAEGRGSR